MVARFSGHRTPAAPLRRQAAPRGAKRLKTRENTVCSFVSEKNRKKIAGARATGCARLAKACGFKEVEESLCNPVANPDGVTGVLRAFRAMTAGVAWGRRPKAEKNCEAESFRIIMKEKNCVIEKNIERT
jgi:hypothetical protein